MGSSSVQLFTGPSLDDPLPFPHDSGEESVEVKLKWVDAKVQAGRPRVDFHVKVMVIGKKNGFGKNVAKFLPGKIYVVDEDLTVAEVVMWPQSRGPGRCDVEAMNEFLMRLSIGKVYEVHRTVGACAPPTWILVGGLRTQLNWTHQCSHLIEVSGPPRLNVGNLPTPTLLSFYGGEDKSRIPCISVRLKISSFESNRALPKFTAGIHDSTMKSVLIALGDVSIRFNSSCERYFADHPDASDVPAFISNVYLKSAVFTTTVPSDIVILDPVPPSVTTDAPVTELQDVGLVSLMSHVDTLVMVTNEEKIATLAADLRDPVHSSRVVCAAGVGDSICGMPVFTSAASEVHRCRVHRATSVRAFDNVTATLVVHESDSFTTQAKGLEIQPELLGRLFPSFQVSDFHSMTMGERQSVLDTLRGHWHVKVHFRPEGAGVSKTILEIWTITQASDAPTNFDTSSTPISSTPAKKRQDRW